MQIIYRVIKQRFGRVSAASTWGWATPATSRTSASRKRGFATDMKTFSMAGYVMSLVYHRAKPVKNFLRNYVPKVR